MAQETIAELIEFVGSILRDGAENSFGPDSRIISDELVDSLGIIELITFIEKKYGINIEEHEMTTDNLDSPRLIASLIERKHSG
jgi:acyl carrier protein